MLERAKKAAALAPIDTSGEYQCPKCPRTFNEKSRLLGHIKSSHKTTWAYCPKDSPDRFMNRYDCNIKTHVLRKHPNKFPRYSRNMLIWNDLGEEFSKARSI